MKNLLILLALFVGTLIPHTASAQFNGCMPGFCGAKTSAGAALACSYAPVTTGTQGTAYTGAIPSASGGTPTYTFSETGSLPSGLTIAPSTGIISGTPSASGTFTGIQVKVTDSTSTVANCGSAFTLVISPSVSPVTMTWQLTANGVSPTGNTESTNNDTIGAAPSANRRVVYAISSGDLATGLGYTISSAVFTPNSGSPISADVSTIIGRDSITGLYLASAVLPVGTTTTLTITFSGTTFGSPRYSLYTVDNSTLSSPTTPTTNFNTNNPATSVTTTVTTLSGGGLIGFGQAYNGGSSFTAGITTTDGAFGNFISGHLSNTSAASPFSVTLSGTSSNQNSLALAAFR